MLKKTGIVVATAALSMLAVSPLAFAGDKSDDHRGGKDDKSHSEVVHKKDDDDKSHDDKKHDDKKHDDKKHDDKKHDEKKVEEGNLANDCEFGNESGDAEQAIDGGSSLLGVVSLVTGTVTNAATQTNALNCTNVNVTDVVDFNSNNQESTAERTFIERSFND